MINGIGYTGEGYKNSKLKGFVFGGLQKKVNEKKSRVGKELEDSDENESDDLEGQGIGKTIIPSTIIDIYTRIEILLGLKL